MVWIFSSKKRIYSPGEFYRVGREMSEVIDGSNTDGADETDM